MNKRLYGALLGVLAGVAIGLVGLGVAAILAITIIGIPFAVLVLVLTVMLMVIAPVTGFIDPDRLIDATRSWPGRRRA